MANQRNIVCICDEIIMKSDNHVGKIRSKVLILRGNDVYAVCKSCGIEVQVPLTVKPMSGPPLILSK